MGDKELKTASRNVSFGAILALLLLASAVFYYRSRHKVVTVETPKNVSNPKVLVRPSLIQEYVQPLSLLGRLEPKTSISVVPKTSGNITEVSVRQGQTVKKGQILAKIETEGKPLEVARAEQAVKIKKSKLEMDKSLFSSGNVSRFTLDASQEAMKQAEAALDLAKRQLSYTQITAPIGGIVERINVKVGDYVNPVNGQAITKIIDGHDFIIKAFVSQSHSSLVKPGQKAEIKFPDGSELEGTLTFLSTQAESSTLSYYLEISVLHSASTNLMNFSGYPTDVKILTRQVDAFKVPSSSLFLNARNKPIVKIVNSDSTIEEQEIEIVGTVEDGSSWVTADSKKSGQIDVVTRGGGFVNSGTRVEAVPE